MTVCGWGTEVLTQLSYLTAEPRARVPRSTALMASAGLLAVVGLLQALDTFHALPPSRLGWRASYQPQCFASIAIWATIFVGSAIAVGRTNHWARAIVLSILPVFLLVNSGGAITRLIVDLRYSMFNGDWPMAAASSPFVICILVFVYFCSRYRCNVLHVKNQSISTATNLTNFSSKSSTV